MGYYEVGEEGREEMGNSFSFYVKGDLSGRKKSAERGSEVEGGKECSGGRERGGGKKRS